MKALTYAGATYDIGAVGGARLRLLHNERTGSQLSLSGAVGYTGGQISTLLPLLDQPLLSAAEALRGDLGEAIKTPFSTFGYEGTFSYAQAISRVFGVQASATLGGASVTTEPYDRLRRTRDSTTDSSVTYELGVAPSVDFNAFHVPIAVMPEYVLSRRPGFATIRGAGVVDTLHTVAVGAYYSGRTTLQVGLIWATLLTSKGFQTSLGESDPPHRNNLELILRYVW